MKLTLLLTLTAFAAFAQDKPKPTPKPFKVPGRPTVTDPIVLRDEGCARDLAKAIQTEGVARNRGIEEVVRYGCLKIYSGTFELQVEKSIDLSINEKALPMKAKNVRLLLPGGAPFNVTGWVFEFNSFVQAELTLALRQ